MAQSFVNIAANYKIRYGKWIDPLPSENTLADTGEFVTQDNRPGLSYTFPVLTGLEHGQTANIDNSAFAINAAIDSQVASANLDGSTILLQTLLSYDSIYKSLNGAGNGNNGGAFKTAMDQAVEAMLRGAELYRELALGYGPGTATSGALPTNIGVLDTTPLVTGTNLGTALGSTYRLTPASWIPGLWILMQNALVDIYDASGAVVAADVQVLARPNPNKAWLTLFKSGSSVVPAATNVIIPKGWRGKSCFGLEAIYQNTGTLFGISAATVAPWQCQTFAVGGALTRSKILAALAIVSMNGTKNGGTLFVSPTTFAALAEEASQLQQFIQNTDKVKRQGASGLQYITSAGDVMVKIWQYAKQGTAWFITNENFKRVGSTDLTMRPIGGGAEAFFTHQPNNAGASIRIFSNQAPVFEKPYQNIFFTGVSNTTDINNT